MHDHLSVGVPLESKLSISRKRTRLLNCNFTISEIESYEIDLLISLFMMALNLFNSALCS